MTEVITHARTGATKAPAQTKAAQAPTPAKPPIDDVSTAASKALSFVSVLACEIIEHCDFRHLGTSIALFEEADALACRLAYGDKNDNPVTVRADDVGRLSSMFKQAIETLESEVANLPSGSALIATTLASQAMNILRRISDAMEAAPATLGPLKELATYAGARPFNDKPQPPIRRAAPDPAEVPGNRFDLHQEYRYATERGFTSDLVVAQHQIQRLHARMQGIATISAVLMTEYDGGTALGEWLTGGLVDAMHCLASDSAEDLDDINERAKAKAGAA